MTSNYPTTKTVRMYGNVRIGNKVKIGDYTVIGISRDNNNHSPVVIGDYVVIGSHVTIYKGAKIGRSTYVEDYALIGENVHIGENTRIIYGAKIYDDARISSNAIVGGFVCERAYIGDYSRVFGELLHFHREPHLGWNDIIEDSPIIEDHVFVGFGAKVIGGIKVGRCSYIVAGAIVTRDVPSQSIVYGINKIIHYSEWRGKLRDSLFFKTCGGR